MENEVKNKQSEVLRKKAGSIEILLIFLDSVIILSAIVYAFVLSLDKNDISTTFAVIVLIFAGVMVYLLNVLLSTKAEFYKTQAEMLDVLNEIKEQNKTKQQ